MKAYGVRKRDHGCCGGHDKHVSPKLRTGRQKKNAAAFRRKDRSRKKRARQLLKIKNTLHNE